MATQISATNHISSIQSYFPQKFRTHMARKEASCTDLITQGRPRPPSELAHFDSAAFASALANSLSPTEKNRFLIPMVGELEDRRQRERDRFQMEKIERGERFKNEKRLEAERRAVFEAEKKVRVEEAQLALLEDTRTAIAVVGRKRAAADSLPRPEKSARVQEQEREQDNDIPCIQAVQADSSPESDFELTDKEDSDFDEHAPSIKWRSQAKAKAGAKADAEPRAAGYELVAVDKVTGEQRDALKNYAFHYVMFSLEPSGFIRRLYNTEINSRTFFAKNFYDYWDVIAKLFGHFVAGIYDVKGKSGTSHNRAARFSVRSKADQHKMDDMIDKLRGTREVKDLLARAVHLYTPSPISLFNQFV